MKKPFKLLIAVPCMDYVHVDFMNSLLKLCQHLQHEGIIYHTETQSGTLIYFARNRLANKAVCENFTHILFIDSDMVFDENIVETLQFADKDVVCGAFQARRSPYGSCVFTSLNPVRRVKEYGMEPFQVEGCGMACTMISTEVIREVQSKYGNPFDPAVIEGITFGEDTAFCWRARKCGYEIWCDPTARIGHIAHVPIYPGEEPAT